MNKITEENLITELLKKFPGFRPNWQSYLEDWGDDMGLTIQLLPFSKYVVDVIKTKNDALIMDIFAYIEFLMNEENVQTAIATSFLEHLMNKNPDTIQFRTFVHHLGPKTVDYCKKLG